MKKEEIAQALKNASFDINILIQADDGEKEALQQKKERKDLPPPIAILRDELTPRELLSTISSLHFLITRLSVKFAEEAKKLDPDLLGIEYYPGKILWNELSDHLDVFEGCKEVRVEIRKDGVHIFGDSEFPDLEEVPDFLMDFLTDQDVFEEEIAKLLESDALIKLKE